MEEIEKRSENSTQNPNEPRDKDKNRQIKEDKESDNPLKYSIKDKNK